MPPRMGNPPGASINVDGTPITALTIDSSVTPADVGAVNAPASMANGDMVYYNGSTYVKVAGTKATDKVVKIQADGSVAWSTDANTGGGGSGAGLDLWRPTYLWTDTRIAASTGAGLKWSGPNDLAVADNVVSGSSPMTMFFDATEFAISGFTPKFRVRAVCHTNQTSPGTTTITMQLYTFTAEGTGTGVAYNLATATGNGAAIVNPGASARVHAESTEFDSPANDWYMFGLNLSNGTAAGSYCHVKAYLEVRWV